jgi:AcrR family transcriptional regulator
MKENLRQRTKTTRPRRQRRSTEEIIDRLLEAACDEFELNGYAGTTTADIARRAGVVEPLIFNHFGSKAKLFHDSIFKPLNRHFVQFLATHLVDANDADSLRANTQQYILELKQFLERHSRMLMSLVVAQVYACDKVQGVSQIEGLNDYFSRAVAMAKKRRTGKPKVDPDLMSRISFATILSCVIFKDWLFPDGLASDDEINAAVSGFVMEGINESAAQDLSGPRLARSRNSPNESIPPGAAALTRRRSRLGREP